MTALIPRGPAAMAAHSYFMTNALGIALTPEMAGYSTLLKIKSEKMAIRVGD
jgi:hypothetical protein